MYADELTTFEPVNVQVGKRVSRFLVGSAEENMYYPHEELLKDLTNTTNQPIFSTDVDMLHVSMDLMHHSIWRKLVDLLNSLELLHPGHY